MIDKNLKNNYDEKPIMLSNKLTVILLGMAFWLLYNFFTIYMIFYTEVIDWSQSAGWLNILEEELFKNFRLGTILLLFLFVNIIAIRTFLKSINSSKETLFRHQIIESDKNFNDLRELNLIDVEFVKKSFFPVLATGHKEKNGSYYMAVIILLPLLILSSVLMFFIKVIFWIFSNDKVYFSTYSYITIFSKKSNRLLNVYIIFEKDYLELKEYFLENLNIDLEEIESTFSFSNLEG